MAIEKASAQEDEKSVKEEKMDACAEKESMQDKEKMKWEQKYENDKEKARWQPFA